MSERAELIIDTKDIDDEDILFLTPNHIRGVRYCASNIFDYASIKNCPTEKLNSGSLIGIFNSLKPGAEISIVVNQPISVMLEYDSKQIEANLKLVGFENILYEEKKSSSKNGIGLTEGILTATKPVNKDNNIQIEIIKSDYSYRNKSDSKRDRENEREDRGGYKIQKKVEKYEEEPPSKYNKGRFGTNTNNVEKKEKEEYIPPKKYNRFQKKEEEEPKPKEDIIQKEIIIKEEKKVRPKRFTYTRTEVKEEKPQIFERKTEIISKRGGKNQPGEIKTKEFVIEKTTVVDKKSDLENKKAGLRKRYGKH